MIFRQFTRTYQKKYFASSIRNRSRFAISMLRSPARTRPCKPIAADNIRSDIAWIAVAAAGWLLLSDAVPASGRTASLRALPRRRLDAAGFFGCLSATDLF
jgi:hypothetical protein